MPRLLRALLMLILFLPSVSWAGQNLAFVTSVRGTGNLSTWPQAQAFSGLAAGDQICRTLATDAALPSPATFVAWLSDSSNDAYCRIHGLSGTIASNCGEAALPVATGPWMRVDGAPFAPAIEELTLAIVFTPLAVDENGDKPGASASSVHWAYTGTDEFGFGLNNCSDWSSESSFAFAAFGARFGTGFRWTRGGNGPCNSEHHLYCLQVGTGDALSGFISGRKVFVTSVEGSGDLSTWQAAGESTGLAAGDEICRTLASSAGLSNAASFKAWLSSETESAASRIENDGAWVRLDDVPIASDLADLLDGEIFTSIGVTEGGDYAPLRNVWTGTTENGQIVSGETCEGWDSALTSAAYGTTDVSHSWWTKVNLPTSCDSAFGRLFCLEDSPTLIFADGFETGETGEWALSEP